MICQVSKKEKKCTENVDWSLSYGILKVEHLPRLCTRLPLHCRLFMLGEHQLG